MDKINAKRSNHLHKEHMHFLIFYTVFILENDY